MMDERLERQRRIVMEHVELENAHRWAEVVDTFGSPDACFELVPAGARLPGKQGIATAYQILSSALPDVQIRIVSATDVPGCSVREVVVTGTHQGEYFGLAPSGNSVRAEMACFFLFDAAGELTTERVYFDNASLLAQMRGEPNAPRGIGL
jgi:steroid delta-isomerase-like uncharacterized protein